MSGAADFPVIGVVGAGAYGAALALAAARAGRKVLLWARDEATIAAIARDAGGAAPARRRPCPKPSARPARSATLARGATR